MTSYDIGDEVKIIGSDCDHRGEIAKITAIITDECREGKVKIQTNLCTTYHREETFEMIGGEKMELKELKKENIKEAEKQYKEEKKNAEIEFAKNELRNATDNINSLDRQIKSLEEQKKPYLEKIKMFS